MLTDVLITNQDRKYRKPCGSEHRERLTTSKLMREITA